MKTWKEIITEAEPKRDIRARTGVQKLADTDPDFAKNPSLQSKEKRDKYKDIMTALKEGKVQKDLKFWHFFDDKKFLKLTRKESVNLIEKEIEKLNKDIINLKKSFEVCKNKLMDLINDNLKFGANISDLDEEVSTLLY